MNALGAKPILVTDLDRREYLNGGIQIGNQLQPFQSPMEVTRFQLSVPTVRGRHPKLSDPIGVIIHEEMNQLVAEEGEHRMLGNQSGLGQSRGGRPREVLHGDPQIPLFNHSV